MQRRDDRLRIDALLPRPLGERGEPLDGLLRLGGGRLPGQPIAVWVSVSNCRIVDGS
jgi:hypothetical protein